MPAATTLALETRTSDDGITWSPFVAVIGNTVQSPNGRLLEYRATLSTNDDNATPVLQSVTIAANEPSDQTPPATSMLVPKNGGSVHGNATVDASASDNVGVTKVEFHATGPGLNDALVGTGTSTLYGWVGSWNTTGRNGAYAVSSVAFDAGG